MVDESVSKIGVITCLFDFWPSSGCEMSDETYKGMNHILDDIRNDLEIVSNEMVKIVNANGKEGVDQEVSREQGKEESNDK